jgi:exosortase/archaeosortase family protein
MKTGDSKTAGVKEWLSTGEAKALGLWLLLSAALSVIFFRDFWTNLPKYLAPARVLNFNTAPLGVLVLCLIFLVLKRDQVSLKTDFKLADRFLFLIVGAVLIAAAVFLPIGGEYQVFPVLLAALGVFVMVFGPGAGLPAVLLVIYGFSIAFPLAIDRYADEAYSRLVTVPLMAIVKVIGYPAFNDGQMITLTSQGGEILRFTISSSCAGPTTMSVFIVLFVLMMMDRPQTTRRTIWLFLFGVVGTWLQNLIRLVILMVIGRNLGNDAMWTAHYWSVYILFPLWYVLFAYIYFRTLRAPAVSIKGLTK